MELCSKTKFCWSMDEFNKKKIQHKFGLKIAECKDGRNGSKQFIFCEFSMANIGHIYSILSIRGR